VDGVVVAHAEQGCVGDVGRPAVLPLGDVMCLAAGGVGSAAGEHAVPVPDLQRAPQAGRDGAVRTSDIEDLDRGLLEQGGQVVLAARRVGVVRRRTMTG
jgi:hypothetical protein